jgi:enoyl-CoA hydratase
MPDEIEAAVGLAERDPEIRVIVLRGAGRAFSPDTTSAMAS